MFGAIHLVGILPILPYFVKDGFISSSAAIGMTIALSLTSSFIVGLETGVALVDYGIGSELNKVGLVQIQVIFHKQIP